MSPASGAAKISLLTATGLVVSNMVGTGVFTSLGFQVGPLPSGFAIMLLWLIGGVCAVCGALAYGELAAALPRSGGEYHFLRETYHPAVGFLAGWLSITVGFAAPIALAAMAFGEYFAGVFPGNSPLVLALLAVAGVTAVHLRGVEFGARFQNAATALKIALIFVFIVAGIFAPATPDTSFTPRTSDASLVVSAPFAISLVYVMYAYTGWNAAAYIVGEVHDPARNVPRAVVLGASFVTVLYLALNATFLHAAPMSELAGKIDVAHVAAARIFGEAGGRIMAGLICLGLIASISAMTWIGPRVSMVMGEDHRLFAPLARRSARGVPAIGLLVQAAIVFALLLTATFQQVVNYVQFSLTLCAMLAVGGIFVLRVRRPDLPRPYRMWGYPVTPLIFLAISGWMLVFTWQSHRAESLAGLATLFAGLALYFISRRKVASPLVALLALAGASFAENVPVLRAEPVVPRAVAATSPNDEARFLAGLPVSGALEPLTRTAAWQTHAAELNSAWASMEARQLTRVRAWAHGLPQANTLLYFFSGPDFLYADLLFPQTANYVLCAREPIGGTGNLAALSEAELAGTLAQLRRSMHTLLRFHYFITKEMRADLAQGRVAGTVPILYVFLARGGHTIRDVQASANSVKIRFTSAHGGTRTLHYFKTDLSNGAGNASFFAFCRQFRDSAALLKSASYLLHQDGFSTCREFLLQHSKAIVQDDSGIPYRAFAPEAWTVRLFGTYPGASGIFAKYHQPDLFDAYRRITSAPLGFSFGYEANRERGALMLATKR